MQPLLTLNAVLLLSLFFQFVTLTLSFLNAFCVIKLVINDEFLILFTHLTLISRHGLALLVAGHGRLCIQIIQHVLHQVLLIRVITLKVSRRRRGRHVGSSSLLPTRHVLMLLLLLLGRLHQLNRTFMPRRLQPRVINL